MCQRDGSKSLVLAERSLGTVSLCGCGTVHVGIGSVTMRLSPEAFCELVVLCRSAADQLLLQARDFGIGADAVVQ